MEDTAVQTYMVDVTPEMAKRWLEKHNHRNRPIRRWRVRILASEMERGRFVNNGEPVRFDRNRELLDGQHRLAAIVESGITLKNQLVVYNLDPDVLATIDTGSKRTLCDNLKIEGVVNSGMVASAARVCVCYEHGDLGLSYQLPDSEFNDYAHNHEQELQAAVSGARRINAAVGGSLAVYTAMLSYCLVYNKEKTEAFIESVASGEGLKKGDPALVFRNYALRNYAVGRKGYAPKNSYQMQIVIGALNAHLLGKKIRILRWREGEAYQKLFFHTKSKTDQAIPSPLAELLKDTEKKTA